MFDRREADLYDELIDGTPSEASFLLLLRTDLSRVSPDAAMAVAIGVQRAKRTLEAIEVQALARAACRPRDPHVPDEVASEFSAGTGMYPSTASHRVETARSAVPRLALGLKALEAAEITYRQLEALDRATRGLSDDAVAEVEAASVPGGSTGFARRLANAIARVAPDHAKKKAEENRSQRTVDNWSDPAEGVAGFGLQGPLDLVALIKAAIDRKAKTREPGECRPLNTRRFDVLLGWARSSLGLDPSEEHEQVDSPSAAASGRSGTALTINVTVSLASLLRLSEQPGELNGMPIPAEVARELAADGRWRRWILEPETGALLDVASTTYRPTAALDRFVRGRDRTCRFPSCTQPSVRCDLDHTKAFHTADGTTIPGNLVALCRHHHRLKHETDWNYRTRPNGDIIWTAPSGREYVDRADDHHDDPTISRLYARAHARQRARIDNQARADERARRVKAAVGAEQTTDPWKTPPDAGDDPLPF